MPSTEVRFRPWEDGAEQPSSSGHAYLRDRTHSNESARSGEIPGPRQVSLEHGTQSHTTKYNVEMESLLRQRSQDAAQDAGHVTHLTQIQSNPPTIDGLESVLTSPNFPSASSVTSEGSEVMGPNRKQTKNVSVACLACRVKRRKCVNDGQPPCESCLASNIACVIDENLDQRRRAAHRRRIAQVEFERQLLGDLVKAIRTGSEVQVTNLVRIIKLGATFEEISEHIGAAVQQSQYEGISEAESSGDQPETWTGSSQTDQKSRMV